MGFTQNGPAVTKGYDIEVETCQPFYRAYFLSFVNSEQPSGHAQPKSVGKQISHDDQLLLRDEQADAPRRVARRMQYLDAAQQGKLIIII